MVNFFGLFYTAIVTALVAGAEGIFVPNVRRDFNSTGVRAIYFMTNKAPNAIVALTVQRDGTLHTGSFTPTGGNGGNEIGATGASNTPDGLSSQDSVIVSGNYLFNVNAASNSVSMFLIAPFDPAKLSLISTVATTGDFPVTVTVSGNNICVGNAGPRAGVCCAKWSPRGVGRFDVLRPFQLNQTAPPSSTLNLLADTFFASDGSALVTTVKGTATNKGFLSIFPVTRNGVSSHGKIVSPNGTAVLFGSDPIPGTSHVFFSDASFGALTLDLNHPEVPLTKTVIPDQLATCWGRVAPGTGTAFITDVRLNHVVHINLNSGAILQEYNSKNGNPGNLDFAVAGSRLYALSPGNATWPPHVAVFDISRGVSDLQNFEVAGADVNSQGLAVLRS